MDFTTAQEAELAFYRAFADSNFDLMRAAWDNEDIVCVHPGGPLMQTSAEIMMSWQQILAALGPVDLKVEVVYRLARPDHAVHVVREHFNRPDHPAQPPVIATNVYRRNRAGWTICAHHASSEPPAAEPADGALH
ncbi:MAG: nuclear transport factor 2 family protein [Chromatiales bacterium]|mgnify:FL=1|jgi:ketosteroid isomerase-like protein